MYGCACVLMVVFLISVCLSTEREKECVCVCVFSSRLECMSCPREGDAFYNVITFCRNQSSRPGRPWQSPQGRKFRVKRFPIQDLLRHCYAFSPWNHTKSFLHSAVPRSHREPFSSSSSFFFSSLSLSLSLSLWNSDLLKLEDILNGKTEVSSQKVKLRPHTLHQVVVGVMRESIFWTTPGFLERINN